MSFTAQSGFTLFEILIALLILGVAFSFASTFSLHSAVLEKSAEQVYQISNDCYSKKSLSEYKLLTQEAESFLSEETQC